MDAKPLVSVFIVTYNSSDYIVEALESVKAQTYNNIELIVSDDKSPDNTVEVVKGWLSENSERFVRTELVEAKVNTGTSGNYNRAVAACKGEWLKMMDGDDLIMPNCIEDNINYVLSNPDAEVVFSDEYCFRSEKTGKKRILSKRFNARRKRFFELNTYEQKIKILAGNCLPSQTCFIKSQLLKANPYNENYTLLEDYPMWVNLLEKGNHFYFFDKCTAMYRMTDSVSSNRQVLFPVYYHEICKSYYLDILLPLIKKYNAEEAYDTQKKYYQLYDFCVRVLRNKRNMFTIGVYWIVRVSLKFFVYHRLN